MSENTVQDLLEDEMPRYGLFQINEKGEEYVIYLDNSFEYCNYYFKQKHSEWKEKYKNKPIESNDKIVFKNIEEDYIIDSFSKLDLL